MLLVMPTAPFHFKCVFRTIKHLCLFEEKWKVYCDSNSVLLTTIHISVFRAKANCSRKFTLTVPLATTLQLP